MFERRLFHMYALICAALGLAALRLLGLQLLGMSAEDPDAVLRRPAAMEEIPTWRGAIVARGNETLAADRAALDLAIDYREIVLTLRAAGDALPENEQSLARA